MSYKYTCFFKIVSCIRIKNQGKNQKIFSLAEQVEKFNLGTVFHKQEIWFEYKTLFNKSGEKGAASVRM